MLKDLKAILKAFDESGSVYLSYSQGDMKIELKKPCAEESQATHSVVMPFPAAYPAGSVYPAGGLPTGGYAAEGQAPHANHAQTNSAEQSASGQNSTRTEGGHEVKSPIVGVFYAAKEPGAAPYVKLGDRVEKGQVLCILESMKMLNEIKAPVAGTVVKVNAANETLVEYGQVLFVLEA